MISQWSKLDVRDAAIIRGASDGQGIFIRPAVVKALGGDGNAAILLHQLLFWSQSEMAEERDGWFFVTSQRLNKDTGLSYDVQERIRRKLVNLGILEQERRGVPAKNYYRLNLEAVSELLVSIEIKNREIPSSRKGESPDLDKENHPIIVKERVNDRVNKNTLSAAPKSASLNILGDKIDSFVAWVVGTYPVNIHGIGATDGQARKVAERIGGYKSNSTEEYISRKRKELQVFITGIKNLKEATDSPEFDRKFVPGFANFAGLGVLYGKEPGYVAWASRKVPEKKQKLVV